MPWVVGDPVCRTVNRGLVPANTLVEGGAGSVGGADVAGCRVPRWVRRRVPGMTAEVVVPPQEPLAVNG